jgi:hypothetical protein
MNIISNARRVTVMATCAATSLSLAASGVLLSASGAAAAITPNSCVGGSGSTGNSGSAGGTVFVKPSDSCHDFNVTYTHDNQGFGNDTYRGALRNSAGHWNLCSKGWTFLSDGNHGIIPFCTSVLPGTSMKMDSGIDAPDTVHVLY